MSEAATPVAPVEAVAPVATAPAPVPAPVTATPATTEKKVEVSEAELHDLRRQAARAKSAQRFASKSGHFTPESMAPRPAPTQEQLANAAAEEDEKARNGILALAIDPVYREVLDADPTLRSLLTTNPLAVLPLLTKDPLDAEDAIEQVKSAFDARKKPAPITAPATAPAPTPVPPVGSVNAADVPNAEYDAAKARPSGVDAAAGMLSARLKMGKQK